MNQGIRPLSELDAVPWATLDHCRGTAENIPDLLQRFAAGSHQAEYDLWDCLWHQHTIYPATLAAIPFVLGLLSAGKRKSSLLSMLGLMAESQGYLLVHGGLLTEDVVQSEDFQSHLAEELVYVPQVREAVKVGLSLYRDCLVDESAELRRSAVYLLSRFVYHEDRVADWLLERLDAEAEESVEASIHWALGFARPTASVLDALHRGLEGPSPYVQFTSGISLLWWAADYRSKLGMRPCRVRQDNGDGCKSRS